MEANAAAEGWVYTAAEIAALEKREQEREVSGQTETHHPGYLGSQYVYYFGMLKGVGRICQHAFVDTYAKVAAARLYTTKTPITSADLLNDRCCRCSRSTICLY